MDNRKFGEYILSLRKEKGLTQGELADMLNVTNKAVSKWERGKSFPDIQMIEPLASALGVSIVEIVKSEKMDKIDICPQDTSETISTNTDLAVFKKKIEIRDLIIGSILIADVILAFLMIDMLPIEAFFLMCLPIIMFSIGIFLIVMSIRRKIQKKRCTVTLILGLVALLYPLLVLIFMAFAMVIGGPVPN